MERVMVIQVDTREHKAERERIESQFDALGVKHIRSKLYVGDYMSLDNPKLIIDRKKDLLEICGNVCQQHERFTSELIRAREAGIKLIILCENGENITCIEDVYFWENPRLKLYKWTTVNGKPKRVKRYPKATKGSSLYKSLCTIRDEYGVDILFCEKKETGKKIIELLSHG
jgi:hypothetical protein